MARLAKKRMSKKDTKAAADRAEKRSKGEEVKAEASPLEPEVSRGRPSEFMTEYVEQAATLCLRGATDEEIAAHFDISVRTLYRWKLQHEDFCQAIKVGKEMADERVARGLYQRSTGYAYKEQQAIKLKTVKFADGKRSVEEEKIEIIELEKQIPPDTTAASLWLRNRRPHEWQDKTSKEISGPGGGPIEVSSVDKLALARWIALQLMTVPEVRTIE
jgi:transposase